jgi:hypothetical protein
MKCHKPNTDQSFTLTAYVNSTPSNPTTAHPAPEYILPTSSPFENQSNVLSCFIPVTQGDAITLQGSFRGTCLHASFDILADGSFVGDKRIEGAKDTTLKFYEKRKLDIKAVLNAPKDDAYTSIYPPQRVIEGRMAVRELEFDERVRSVVESMSVDDYEEGDGLGVGSLVVKVSLNQDQSEWYKEDYGDYSVGEWIRRKTEPGQMVSHGGIVPEFCIEVEDGGETVHKNRQSKHRRHLKQTRFGKAPWATFIFYYRTNMAIQRAGCLQRSDKSQELIDDGPHRFVNVAPTPKKKKGTTVRESPDGSEFTDATSPTGGEAQGFPMAPMAMKKKLFGQKLPTLTDVKPEVESDSLFVSPLKSSERVDRRQSSGLGSHLRNESEGDGTAEVDIADVTGEGEKNVQLSASVNGNVGGKEYDDLFDLFGSDSPGDIGLFTGSNPSSTPKNGPSPANVAHATTETISENIHPTPSKDGTSGASTGTITHDEIRALASKEGTIDFDNLVKYCDANLINQDIGIRAVQEIAFKCGTSYILKQRPGSFVQPHAVVGTQDGSGVIVDGGAEGEAIPEQAAIPDTAVEEVDGTMINNDPEVSTHVTPEVSLPSRPIQQPDVFMEETAATVNGEAVAQSIVRPTTEPPVEPLPNSIVPAPPTPKEEPVTVKTEPGLHPPAPTSSPAVEPPRSTPNPLKRPASAISPAPTDSREGTPGSKRSKKKAKSSDVTEMQAKLEARRVAVAEKMKMKAEALKAKEERDARKKARLEKEREEKERMQKELDELDRMNNEADEEIAALQAEESSEDDEDEESEEE